MTAFSASSQKVILLETVEESIPNCFACMKLKSTLEIIGHLSFLVGGSLCRRRAFELSPLV